jgi:hypothetical protein
LSKPRAPHAKPAPAHEPESPAEEPVAGAAFVRVKQNLRGRAAAALDAGIACLVRLRSLAGGAAEEEAEPGDDGPGSRRADRREDSGSEVEPAPEPRRRRGIYAFLGVLLLGGAAGGALAYGLLTQALEHRAAEIRSQAAALAALAQTEAESQEKREQQQALRLEAETPLASALAERAREAQRPAEAGSAGPGGNGGSLKAGDCALGGGNAGAVLKRCIDEFNRH